MFFFLSLLCICWEYVNIFHNSIYLLFALTQDYTAKLSDFGLAKAGPEGDQTHVSTRVMGTYGYAAPEYVMTGTVLVLSFLNFLHFFLSSVVTLHQNVTRLFVKKKSLPSNMQVCSFCFALAISSDVYIPIGQVT